MFPLCVPEFNDVMSAEEISVTVERVAACAGVSSDTAKALEATTASANFALRVSFIFSPRGLVRPAVESRPTPHWCL